VLRDGPAAAGAMEEALARLPAERARDASWYRAHLASARARVGDLDGALRDAEEAARLGRLCGSSWTLGELDQLAERPRFAPLREALYDVRGSLSGTS
jgi:hypothetical protein